MPFGPLLLVLSVTSALPIFLSVSRLPTDRAEDLHCLVTLAWLAGAVARSHRCCRGALASLLPCRSCVTAAVRSLHRGCRAALAHHCCCAALAWLLHAVHGALASLLPCLSRLAAAAAFSP